MYYSDPAKSLQIARERMTAEQWARFERDFSVFCDIHGLPSENRSMAERDMHRWAKWAFFQGRQYQHATQTPHAQAPCSCPCNKYPDCGCGRQFDIAHYERLAIAMMTDEQAEASLERWRGVKGEAE